MRRVLLWVFVAGLLSPAVIRAQDRPTLQTGSVVRVTAPDLPNFRERVIGTLVSASADSVVLADERDGALVTIPAPGIRRVEVWDPTVQKSPLRAILLSAGLGAAAGLGVLTIDRAGQSLPEAAKYPGMLLVGVGLLAGPSAPSWYAGNRGTALVHLGVTVALATGFALAYCPESCTDAEERTMLLLVGAYALNWIVGTVDGAIGAARYRRWVEVPPSRLRVGLVPLPDGHSGLGISVRF